MQRVNRQTIRKGSILFYQGQLKDWLDAETHKFQKQRITDLNETKKIILQKHNRQPPLE